MFKEMRSPDGKHKKHLIMWVETSVQCPNVARRQNDP